jgi:hypothetical protein
MAEDIALEFGKVSTFERRRPIFIKERQELLVGRSRRGRRGRRFRGSGRCGRKKFERGPANTIVLFILLRPDLRGGNQRYVGHHVRHYREDARARRCRNGSAAIA